MRSEPYGGSDFVPDVLHSPVKIRHVSCIVPAAHALAEVYNVDGGLLVSHLSEALEVSAEWLRLPHGPGLVSPRKVYLILSSA